MSSRPRKQTRRFATLKAWRESKHFTLREAADYLELPYTSYYNYEQAARCPRQREMRARIVERTGVRVEFLAGVA